MSKIIPMIIGELIIYFLLTIIERRYALISNMIFKIKFRFSILRKECNFLIALIIINAITYVFIGELFYISEFISGIFLGFSTGIIIFMNTIRSDYEEK